MKSGNLDSVKAVLNSIQELKSEYGNRHISWTDTSTSRIKCWTNTNVHHFAQDALGIQEHIAEHDLRTFGPKSLLKQTYCRVQGKRTNCCDGGVNTDQIVERDGGASRQLDENQLPTMDVSLDQKATTCAAKQRAATQLHIKLSKQTQCCQLRH